MLPRRLSGRLVLAFAGLALAVLLAVGATLFVVLERIYASDAQDSLVTVSVALATRPNALASGRLPLSTLIGPRSDVAASNVSVYVERPAGLELVDGPDVGLSQPDLPVPSVARSVKGTATGTSGRYLYGAIVFGTVTRRTVGVDAIVVAAPDRSQAQALGSLAVALPAVLVALLLVGTPIVWLLSRSVTRPLARLARATADVPARAREPQPPLPAEGPAEVQELTAHFNAMASALAARQQAESRMLANLRHDLRTPLTSIAGYAQAIADGTAAGDRAAGAGATIVEEAGRLERLVAELGTIERLTEGSAALRPETLDARATLQAAADRFAAQAEAQGVTIGLVAAEREQPPLELTADRLAVERILQNLVSNALSVVPAGGHVWLQAGRLERAGRLPSLFLAVSDDGPGFPGRTLEHVFERFFRGDPARSGSGSGLGLAIVRELARAHGGEAWAENLQPHGARITVALPIVPTPPVAGTRPRPADGVA